MSTSFALETSLATLRKLALVASRTGNPVIVTDREAKVEWVNEAFTRVTDRRRDEVLGKDITTVFQSVEADPEALLAWHRAIRRGEAFEGEIVSEAPSGRRYWLEIDCRPYHSADGKLLGYIAVESEITGRKAMEAQLRQSEARLRAVVESLPDVVFRISVEGVFLDVHTPSMESLVYPPSQLVGRHVSAALPSSVARLLLEGIEDVISHRNSSNFEYQMEAMGRIRDFEVRMVAISANDVLAIVRDVTDRKLLDVMKDEFISTVSHEVRTPLTAIQGALGLLSTGVLGPLEPIAQELVNSALGNAERLGRLVNDILDLDQVTKNGFALSLQPTPLSPLLTRAVTESAPFALMHGISYVVESLEEGALAVVDGDRFMQVIHNLLSNAVKYGNPNDWVYVGCQRDGRHLRVYVRNRGAPIPENFRCRMFTRFAVLDGSNMRLRQGTGLGLAIARALVEKMGGQIDYRSSADFTEFFVMLPECVEGSS